MQAYSYRKLLFNFSYKKKSRRISLRKYWSCLDDDNKKSILISGGGEVGAIEAVGEGGVIEVVVLTRSSVARKRRVAVVLPSHASTR